MAGIKGILELTTLVSSGCKRTQQEIEFLAVIEELQAMDVKKEQIDSYYQYTVEHPIDFRSTLKNILQTLKYLRIAAQIQEIEFNAQESFDHAVKELKDYFETYTRVYG
jgi:thiamine pyrophosphate-dependent acetolactate synthase large subunit-like protein